MLFLFHLNNTNFEFACGTNFDVAFCDCVDETFNQRSLANLKKQTNQKPNKRLGRLKQDFIQLEVDLYHPAIVSSVILYIALKYINLGCQILSLAMGEYRLVRISEFCPSSHHFFLSFAFYGLTWYRGGVYKWQRPSTGYA